jgi:hypothetical protein
MVFAFAGDSTITSDLLLEPVFAITKISFLDYARPHISYRPARAVVHSSAFCAAKFRIGLIMSDTGNVKEKRPAERERVRV